MSPHRYRLVVEGELGSRYASAFGDMTLSAQKGETAITGTIVDSAHLHGLLERVASLGLTLLSVNRLEAESPTAEREASSASGGPVDQSNSTATARQAG